MSCRKKKVHKIKGALLEKIKVISQNISPEDSTSTEGYKNSDATEIITQLKETFAACEKRSKKSTDFNNTSQKLEYSKISNRIWYHSIEGNTSQKNS